MKMIHYSLVATYVAFFAAVDAAHPLIASDAPSSKSAISVISHNESILAEAKKEAKGPRVNVDQNGVILKGYDPVAYFKENRPVQGDAKYSSSYGGAIYYFASASDKAEFDKTPAKYAPQYGGYCANGMTKRKFHDIDPNAFHILKGKLYVCQSAQAAKAFRSDPEANIKKADANWRFYQPPTNPGFRRELGS